VTAPKLAEILVKDQADIVAADLAIWVREKVVLDELRGHPAAEGHLRKPRRALASARSPEFEKLISEKKIKKPGQKKSSAFS
jgi:hypothetical protein